MVVVVVVVGVVVEGVVAGGGVNPLVHTEQDWKYITVCYIFSSSSQMISYFLAVNLHVFSVS